MSSGTNLPEAVLVVGASGFIGRNIVQSLKDEVPILVGVTSRGGEVEGCTQTVSLAELGGLGPLPQKTILIHVAAKRYDAATFRQDQSAILAENTAMTNTIFAFAASHGIKEVRQASSAAVYPASFDVLDDERPFAWNDWPHQGESAYAWSKRWGEIVAEHYRRSDGIATLSFRLSNPYGPFDTADIDAAHVATAFALRALQPGDVFAIRGNPEARRDFVFAGDVAAVFKASLSERGEHEALNLGLGRTISVRDLAEAAVSAAGQSKTIVVEGETGSGVAVRAMTTEKLKRRYPGLAFRNPREGLAETIRWYSRQGGAS